MLQTYFKPDAPIGATDLDDRRQEMLYSFLPDNSTWGIFNYYLFICLVSFDAVTIRAATSLERLQNSAVRWKNTR